MRRSPDVGQCVAVLGSVAPGVDVAPLADTGFLIAIGMAAFAILFGTRHLDANEHHEGVVAAIAFESSVKLLALLAVGIFAAFFLAPAVTEIGSASCRARVCQYV